MLEDKSIVQLRAIAQGYGITDIFAKDENELRQAILLKQDDMAPKTVVDIPQPQYDPRLMTRAPSRRSNQVEIDEALEPYVAMGMHVRFDEERWYFSHGIKTDEGPIRMPLRNIVLKAAEVMK